MRVTCPYCEAMLETETHVPAVRCGECLRSFNTVRRETVSCPSCGCTLAAPLKARVIRCGQCGERVKLTADAAAEPSSQSVKPDTETSFPPDEPAGESGSRQETSVIEDTSDLQRQRLLGVQREFAGKYEVLESLGQGGMGAIYKARQKQPPRVVVLKVMLSGRFASERYRVRFEREAQAVARLKHPNIVAVYEYGEVSGLPYFTMEYVEGCDIKEYALRHRLNKRQICELVMKICRAVAYAHQRGVIHRDLKPNNILVDGQGNPRLLDFGLARLAGDYAEETPHMTEAGEVMGTPSYMSPEQTLGRPEEIDVRSDVYSIGVLFYELLTDTLPYRVDRTRPLESLRKIREYIPRRPSEINPKIDSDLDCVLMKCLEKERELRYQSAVELCEDIGRYLRGQPVEARPSTTFYRLRKLLWRHRGVFLPIGGALLLVLVVTAVSIRWLAVSRAAAEGQVRLADAGTKQLLEKQESLKRFISEVQGVRRTVDGLIAARKWEDAYGKASFAEQELGAAYGYEGYGKEVRDRIAGAAAGELEYVGKLTEQLHFQEARERMEELRTLSERLGLSELGQQVVQMAGGFDEACWQSLLNQMRPQGGSVRVLRKFLEECPSSAHAAEGRDLLSKLMLSIRFPEWPFAQDEAGRRQEVTARVLEVAARRQLQLSSSAALSLVLIPAGDFIMGSSGDGSSYSADQKPEHRVRVTSPFYMTATEVTRAQFEAVTGRVLQEGKADGEDNAQAANLPVTVSWEEARLFCEQLSRRTKLAVRLPSEAEWEYACRAGSASAFGWGEEKDEALLADYSWCRSNSGRQAHPVGLSKPNAWGLWDMHGNVLEWCSDWYDPRYYSSAPVQDPRGPEAGTHKVLRGGSWAQGADELRCAYREAAQPDAIGPTYGFRACIEVFAEPSETSTPQTVLPLMR